MSYLFETLSPNFSRNQLSMLSRESLDLEQPDPGLFTGLDRADTYNNALLTIGAEAKAVGGLALSQWPKALDNALDTGETFQDLWMGAVVDPAISQRKSLRLDPRTHGVAAQVVNGLGTMVPEAIATGPLGVGVLSGISDTAEQIQEGKPLETAAEFGAVTGLANAVGIAAPTALPVSKAIKVPALLQRASTGAVTNSALGIPERYAKHQILVEAGYPEQAEQWQWNDATAMAIDATLGAGFGALSHLSAKPSDIDAALTANESRSIDSKAPGIPASPEIANVHTDTFYQAMDNVLNDKPVTAALPLSIQPPFSPELIALAGNRMSRGERQTLEQQKTDIEYKLTRFDDEAILSGYAKQDFIDQARVEQPRAPARKVAAIADKMAQNAKQSDRADLQTILDTINHKLSRDDEYRAAYAELSRIEQQHLRDNGFIRSPAIDEAQDVIQATTVMDHPTSVFNADSRVRDEARLMTLSETEKTATAVDTLKVRSVSPEIDAAREWLNSHGDRLLPYLNDDGTEQQTSLRELLSEVDNDLADLNNLDAATQAAVNCFLKFGDHL